MARGSTSAAAGARSAWHGLGALAAWVVVRGVAERRSTADQAVGPLDLSGGFGEQQGSGKHVTIPPCDIPAWVPVFPLPESVLFPRQFLPLHVFEPRYLAMVEDVLAGSRCIAVALLKPRYEPHYFTHHAPIHSIVGVGRMVAVERRSDGCCDILLRGEGRAQLLGETNGRPYRLGRLRALASRCHRSPAARARLRRELITTILESPLGRGSLCAHIEEALEAPVSLGDLCDLIAGWLPVAGSRRQELLAELDVGRRAGRLIRLIRSIELRCRCPHELRTRWHFN